VVVVEDVVEEVVEDEVDEVVEDEDVVESFSVVVDVSSTVVVVVSSHFRSLSFVESDAFTSCDPPAQSARTVRVLVPVSDNG
jgi:hypothetical protein